MNENTVEQICIIPCDECKKSFILRIIISEDGSKSNLLTSLDSLKMVNKNIIDPKEIDKMEIIDKILDKPLAGNVIEVECPTCKHTFKTQI